MEGVQGLSNKGTLQIFTSSGNFKHFFLTTVTDGTLEAYFS